MPHRISVKALIAKDVALRLMWYHWRAGLFMYYLIYRGPIIPEARWPILMCGTWHDGR